MSSKRAVRRRSCEGKHRYENARAGIEAIRSLNRRKGYSGQMNAYLCVFCSAFHIGHRPRPKPQRRRAP